MEGRRQVLSFQVGPRGGTQVAGLAGSDFTSRALVSETACVRSSSTLQAYLEPSLQGQHHYCARVFWNGIMMTLPSFLNPLLPFCQAVLGQGTRLLPYRSMAFICPLPSFSFSFSFFFVFCFVFKLQHCLANGLGIFSANSYILTGPIPITLPSFFEEPGSPATSSHESLLAFTALLAFLLGPWK